MEPHFKRAVIYGVGLLGGSLGMALLKRRMADVVVGLGRNAPRLEAARRMGALTETATDAAAALKGADAIFLCLPPRLIRERIAEIFPHVEKGAFVTDVGSVKGSIVEAGERDFADRALFIGSHPMAGSEKSGFEAAREDLYENAACIVTPTDNSADAALSLAVGFWRALGSRVIVMNPARHDELLASISHLPHLAAVGLIETLYSGGDGTHLFRAIAGNGFRDTTRIAAGEAALWEEIFSENAPALIQHLDRLIEILTSWRELLNEGADREKIAARLARAAVHRRELADPNANEHE